MNKNRKMILLKKIRIILFVAISFSFLSLNATNYYIDAINGNDLNNGLSASSPWKTLTHVNTTMFQAGDDILFHAGDSWFGTLKPQGSGVAGSPITIGKYGTGVNPVIHGDGTINCTSKPGKITHCTIYLNNQEYWVIQDLEITNYNSNEEGGISLEQWESNNITNYVNVLLPNQYTGNNTEKCAILVEGNNMGAINYLHFINLEIHGVNGDISEKDNGGIFLKIYNYNSSDTPTYFDDLLFDNCYIHDVDRTGISNRSDYDNRTLTTNVDWTPSLNYIVRYCTFERTGANALIFRISDSPLVEHNLFTSCSIKGSGNACFNFNTDNALMRFNEGRFTKYNVGDNDAGGIDSDFRTKNTTIEYNYIHDNDFGTLITGGPGTGTGFNDNTIFRYNILENDGVLESPGYGAWAFKISGNATNTHVYNNVIYVGASKNYTDIVYHKSWSGGEPDGSVYNNNIFYNDGANTAFNIGSSTNNSFSNNLFFGNDMSNEPSDANKVITDPKFSFPGGGESGYTLASDSPALAIGLRVATSPDKDYYQNSIPSVASIDIGVEQVTQVFVEPPVNNNIAVIEDSYVRGGANGDTNYNGDVLTIKESPTNADFSRQAWLKFDVSGYNDITSATLFMSGNQSSGSVFDISVYEVVDDSWSEGTITWNNAPAQSTLIGSFATAGDTDSAYQDFQIDVTDYVQTELSGDKIVSVNLADAISTNNQFRIYNSEGDSGIAAYLRIEGTTLGIENKIKSEFSIYPNPIDDSFVIQTPNSKIASVSIFSINGSELFNNNSVNSNNLKIDISSFYTGVYFAHIKNSQGVLSVKKLIKK